MRIDLNFRPTSYADFDDPVSLALNGIKGQMRREMVRDMLSAEGEKREMYDAVLGPIEDRILEESASKEHIQRMNRTHGPWWMGGEYLPDLAEGEAEIARIVLASVMLDVFSVRARLEEGAYHYSMADEYETSISVQPLHSEQPLTLGEVVALLDSADNGTGITCGSFVEAWWLRQWENGESPETCTAFAWVESEQYPQLSAYYQKRARQWRVERAAERAREGAVESGGEL